MKKLWFLGFLITLSGCNGCATSTQKQLAFYKSLSQQRSYELAQAEVNNQAMHRVLTTFHKKLLRLEGKRETE